jgi:ribosome maturation factor RimP
VSVTALPSHVQELADRVASGHGVEVLELALRGRGRGRVLSVVLDAEEPVEADVVELVSKDLSRALDEDDPVAGSYTLEVSTPGLTRPLHTRRDFRRQRGHEVTIIRAGSPGPGSAGEAGDARVAAADDPAAGPAGSDRAAGAAGGDRAATPVGGGGSTRGAGERAGDAGAEPGASSIRGVVVDADDDAVVLDVDGARVRVPLSEVVRGKVVLPW